MAATTLTELPSVIYAGDNLLLSVSLADYPASDGWNLTYEFGSDISFTSTASGTAHYFDVDGNTTGNWNAGIYPGIAYVSNGTDRYTVQSAFLEVKLGLSTQPFGEDRLPWYFSARDSMRTVVAGKASRDILNSTIAGQTVGRLTPQQAIELLEYLESKCTAYMEQLAADNGTGGQGHLVKIRFNRP